MRIRHIRSALCLAALILLFPQPGRSAAAGFCMAMSSVSVVTSSLLLRNYQPPPGMRPQVSGAEDMRPIRWDAPSTWPRILAVIGNPRRRGNDYAQIPTDSPDSPE